MMILANAIFLGIFLYVIFIIFCLNESFYEYVYFEKVFSPQIYFRYQKPHFAHHYILYFVHIISSSIWMLNGIYQFGALQGTKIHKINGYIYIVASFMSATTAPLMAYFYDISNVINLGAISLMFCYFYTIYKMLSTIKNHNINLHKFYNIINYSIGVGSIIMRPMLMFCRYIIDNNVFTDDDIYKYYFNITSLLSFWGLIIIVSIIGSKII